MLLLEKIVMVIKMFNGYKIIKNVLYLSVDDKCEIGSIFKYDSNHKITDSIRDFIKKHKIKFSGTKVLLLVSGIVIGSVYLNNVKESNNNVYSGYYVHNIVDKSIPKLDKKVEDYVKIKKEENKDTAMDNTVKSSNETKNNTIKNDNSIIIQNKKVKSEVKENLNSVSNTTDEVSTNDIIIEVKRKNNNVIKISLDDYLVGVVASEMPASFSDEALKAQAVVARTYTLKLIESKRVITDDVSTQVYKDNNELMNMWGNSYEKNYNKIKNAVSSTHNVVIKYNGNLIDAVYHSTSNGYTEDAKYVWNNDIPYLKSVSSPWDASVSSFFRENSIDFNTISDKLGILVDSNRIIEIISRDESNRVSKIKINDIEYSGVNIRNLLQLRSADFDIDKYDNGITFKTKGYGHGVGMSQYGANEMAKIGYTYDKIISYYYTNVNLEKI